MMIFFPVMLIFNLYIIIFYYLSPKYINQGEDEVFFFLIKKNERKYFIYNTEKIDVTTQANI